MTRAPDDHMLRLLEEAARAQAEVNYYECKEDRGCGPYRPSHDRRPRERYYSDSDSDSDGGSDDSLDDLNDQIAHLELIAAQKLQRPVHGFAPHPQRQIFAIGGPPETASQVVVVDGHLNNQADSCQMDAVFIPEDVDVEYDAQGNATIHKRVGTGGIKSDVITVPNRGHGQRFPEESIDAFVPLAGEHTFKVEAPTNQPQPQPQPQTQLVQTQLGHVHQHGATPHLHAPGPAPGPIIHNGQLMVPTGRYKVEKIKVKKGYHGHRH